MLTEDEQHVLKPLIFGGAGCPDIESKVISRLDDSLPVGCTQVFVELIWCVNSDEFLREQTVR
jgi:hypothetical protein